MMSNDITARCDMCLPMVSEHIDGELSLENQSDLFLHLGQCDSCRQQYNAWFTLREGVRNERINVSPGMDEGFFSKLDNRKKALKREKALTRKGLPSRYGSYVMVAAIVCFLTLTSTLILTSFLTPPPSPEHSSYSEIPKQVLYVMPEVTVYYSDDEQSFENDLQ